MPSSVITAYVYDYAAATLRITYTSGAMYEYLDVPAVTYEAFKAAREKGVFLNKHIKGAFLYKKLEESDPFNGD